MSERRTAFVSGASRGIGMAIVELFVAEGWRVAIGDVDLSEAKSVAARLSSSAGKGNVIAVSADVTKSASVEAGIETAVEAFGQLNALINVAGTVNPQPSQEVTDKDWADLLAVHLDGTFRCCRAAYPALVQSNDAAIVSISSVAASIGIPKRLSYSAAKAAIEGMTRVLAVEWAEVGIRVNAVAPGYTDTHLVREWLDLQANPEAARESVLAQIPLGRIADPTEIANAVVFLLSDRASAITGATLAVDCGLGVRFAT